MRTTPGSEPIAEPEELRLEYRHKDGLSHRRLDDLVLQCSDAQRSCSPVRLRYLHPPGRKRPVPSAMNPVMQVEQSLFQPVVARRNDVNANLVFTWRRQFREQAGGAGGLVPVVVEPAGTPPPLADAAAGAAPAAGRMEIALGDGSRVIVDREVDGSALARVLSVLARR